VKWFKIWLFITIFEYILYTFLKIKFSIILEMFYTTYLWSDLLIYINFYSSNENSYFLLCLNNLVDRISENLKLSKLIRNNYIMVYFKEFWFENPKFLSSRDTPWVIQKYQKFENTVIYKHPKIEIWINL